MKRLDGETMVIREDLVRVGVRGLHLDTRWCYGELLMGGLVVWDAFVDFLILLFLWIFEIRRRSGFPVSHLFDWNC